MADLLPIGRFAQITRLTIKALHIYAANGLLRPVYVDPATGYRYYSITQLTVARRIRLLRSLDMPLDTIKAIVQSATPEATDALLHEHQQRILTRIAHNQQILRLMGQLLEHQDEYMAFTVQVKQLSPQPVVSIRIHTTPADELQAIPLLIDELQAYVLQTGIGLAHAPPVRISHTYTEEHVDTEIAVPCTQLVEGNGRISGRVLEGGSAAYVMHVGPHAELWAVYWAILEWTQEHGRERAGPPREVYWMHPCDGHSSEYRTEVLWPISGGQHGR